MIDHAILLKESVHRHGSYPILVRHPNGVIVAGPRADRYIAITVDAVKATALKPLVGEFHQGHGGWIFCEGEEPVLEYWLRRLRQIPRLEWLRRLKAHIEHRTCIKLAIEDYSDNDIPTLGQHGWYIGRSARAPLWRIYALIPKDTWESDELPYIEGEVRTLQRFGAIYDPEKHPLEWNLRA